MIVGSDIGVFASIDGGGRWFRLKANLPDVAVHDLMIHPRENDLVIASTVALFGPVTSRLFKNCRKRSWTETHTCSTWSHEPATGSAPRE